MDNNSNNTNTNTNTDASYGTPPANDNHHNITMDTTRAPGPMTLDDDDQVTEFAKAILNAHLAQSENRKDGTPVRGQIVRAFGQVKGKSFNTLKQVLLKFWELAAQRIATANDPFSHNQFQQAVNAITDCMKTTLNVSSIEPLHDQRLYVEPDDEAGEHGCVIYNGNSRREKRGRTGSDRLTNDQPRKNQALQYQEEESDELTKRLAVGTQYDDLYEEVKQDCEKRISLDAVNSGIESSIADLRNVVSGNMPFDDAIWTKVQTFACGFMVQGGRVNLLTMLIRAYCIYVHCHVYKLPAKDIAKKFNTAPGSSAFKRPQVLLKMITEHRMYMLRFYSGSIKKLTNKWKHLVEVAQDDATFWSDKMTELPTDTWINCSDSQVQVVSLAWLVGLEVE